MDKTINIEITTQQKKTDSTKCSFPFFSIDNTAFKNSKNMQKIYGHNILSKILLLLMLKFTIFFLRSLNEKSKTKKDNEQMMWFIADIRYFLNLKKTNPKREKTRFKIIVSLNKKENSKKQSLLKILKLIPCFVSMFKPLMKFSVFSTFMLKIYGNKNKNIVTTSSMVLIKSKDLEQSNLILQNMQLKSSYIIKINIKSCFAL